MRKTIAYLAQSLDGYIATTDERVDWLEAVETVGDAGYQAFYDTIDTVVMGRVTYDWVRANMGEYPYSDKKSYVVSRRSISVGEKICVTGDAAGTIAELKQQDGRGIWIVGGGLLISDLINKGLVDELRITVAPLLLGSGIALFNGVDDTVHLRLDNTARYGQFIELDYTIDRDKTDR